jgi:hypothetical protein
MTMKMISLEPEGTLTAISNLAPEIVDALRRQYEAAGVVLNSEALANCVVDESIVALVNAMGSSPDEVAQTLIEKLVAADIELCLPTCVRQVADATLVSMPLEDLRFAHGYLALVEAGACIAPDQITRAIHIVGSLRGRRGARGSRATRSPDKPRPHLAWSRVPGIFTMS